jgi:hypothetical protein
MKRLPERRLIFSVRFWRSWKKKKIRSETSSPGETLRLQILLVM